MGRLPDRFDLWLLKANECPDPARQLDYILGAMIGLKEWWLINIGTKEKPSAAKTQVESDLCVLVFSDLARLEEFLEGKEGLVPKGETSPTIAIPSPAALGWCVDCGVGLIVNPDEAEGTVLVPFEQVKAFHTEWMNRGGSQTTGFWIPNMSSEEEDFWQQHGM
jgi:hypothetical protein